MAIVFLSAFLISVSHAYQAAYPYVANMAPNGAGNAYERAGYCFEIQAGVCVGGANATLDYVTCGTGQATSDSNANYVCTGDQLVTTDPSQSTMLRPVATGSGNLCYSSSADCFQFSSCVEANPCVFDVTTCSTGVASNFSSSNWFCPMDRVSKALPNGGGQLCFQDAATCHADFNNICQANGTQCTLDQSTCSTGASAGMGFNYFCASVTPPSGIPNGAGSMCFAVLQDCQNAANACDSNIPCRQDYVSCGTGQAGPTPAWYNCPIDTPKGATGSGSGELCYDTVLNCNNGPNPCSLANPCVLDFPFCASGAATLGGNYRCSLSQPMDSLPQGGGKLCYGTQTECRNGPNACNSSNPCYLATPECATGPAAANTTVVWLCAGDLPSGSTPNGGGQFCFTTQDACTNSPNACGPSTVACVLDVATCSTGVATQSTAANWYCPADTPKGGVSNGAGSFCYDTALDCNNGPNGCSISAPCTLDYSTCSTGQAAGLPNSNWFCAMDLPPNSIPNGAGELCYKDATSCFQGPNSCQPSNSSQCTSNIAMCSTGQASQSGYTYFCQDDLAPSSLPSGFGSLCYSSLQSCSNGPNACNSTTTSVCVQDYVTCSTGIAGPTSNWYICPNDIPQGATMTGGGLLCYDTVAHCNFGPNPCSLQNPCVLDITTCATGPAALGGNWVCPLSAPVGATPAVTGILTYGTTSQCLAGPNACMLQSDCVTSSTFLTGAAALNSIAIVCKYDEPAGASLNTAGLYCYDTYVDCIHGPNACSAMMPCAVNPSACGSGPASAANATFYCSYDSPIGSIFSTSQDICYSQYMNCTNGPNACGLNIPCVDESKGRCATGPAKGVAQWACTGAFAGTQSTKTPVSTAFQARFVWNVLIAAGVFLQTRQHLSS